MMNRGHYTRKAVSALLLVSFAICLALGQSTSLPAGASREELQSQLDQLVQESATVDRLIAENVNKAMLPSLKNSVDGLTDGSVGFVFGRTDEYASIRTASEAADIAFLSGHGEIAVAKAREAAKLAADMIKRTVGILEGTIKPTDLLKRLSAAASDWAKFARSAAQLAQAMDQDTFLKGIKQRIESQIGELRNRVAATPPSARRKPRARQASAAAAKPDLPCLNPAALAAMNTCNDIAASMANRQIELAAIRSRCAKPSPPGGEVPSCPEYERAAAQVAATNRSAMTCNKDSSGGYIPLAGNCRDDAHNLGPSTLSAGYTKPADLTELDKAIAFLDWLDKGNRSFASDDERRGFYSQLPNLRKYEIAANSGSPAFQVETDLGSTVGKPRAPAKPVQPSVPPCNPNGYACSQACSQAARAAGLTNAALGQASRCTDACYAAAKACRESAR